MSKKLATEQQYRELGEKIAKGEISFDLMEAFLQGRVRAHVTLEVTPGREYVSSSPPPPPKP